MLRTSSWAAKRRCAGPTTIVTIEELSGLWKCKLELYKVRDGTHGEVGVYGLFCDEGEACDAACAMILLALLRSLNDLCFLLLVDFPAR